MKDFSTRLLNVIDHLGELNNFLTTELSLYSQALKLDIKVETDFKFHFPGKGSS